MSRYAEPPFYRLNQDSLQLVEFVLRQLGDRRPLRILDLGAGSGVIGIELANHLRPTDLTLVELQPEWEPYLSQNISQGLRSTVSVRTHLTAFGDWSPDGVYDLIVSNPPYFLPGHGRPSPDPRRELCRTFNRDGWAVLLRTIQCALASDGFAFIVLRNDPRVRRELDRHWPRPVASVTHDGGLAFVTLTGCKSTSESP